MNYQENGGTAVLEKETAETNICYICGRASESELCKTCAEIVGVTLRELYSDKPEN